jgi:hypothetical protein
MKNSARSTAESFIELPTLRVGYLTEPLLEFADGRKHVDPKTGIIRFGPKSLRPGTRHPSRIRTGFIGTPDTIQKAGDWIERASGGVRGAPERLEFPGFRKDRGFFSEIELSSGWNAPLFGNELTALSKIKRKSDQFVAAIAMLDDRLSILSRKDRPPEYVLVALPDDLLAKCGTVEVTSAEHGKVFRNMRRAIKAVAMKYRLPNLVEAHNPQMAQPWAGTFGGANTALLSAAEDIEGQLHTLKASVGSLSKRLDTIERALGTKFRKSKQKTKSTKANDKKKKPKRS